MLAPTEPGTSLGRTRAYRGTPDEAMPAGYSDLQLLLGNLQMLILQMPILLRLSSLIRRDVSFHALPLRAVLTGPWCATRPGLAGGAQPARRPAGQHIWGPCLVRHAT